MAELKIISMDEVPVEEVEWLWYPYIPYGKLTIIHGDGGEGKTTLILRLAALLSRGEKLPCDDMECSLSSRQTKKQKNIKLSEFHPVAQQGGIFHAAAAEWYSIGVIHLSFNW